MERWFDGCLIDDGWMYGLIDGWLDGWVDSLMDGWIDGWMYVYIYI